MGGLRGLAVLCLLVACSQSSEPDPVTEAAGELPCDVDDVAKAVCQECHGERQRYGAPMRLVTRADFLARSVSDPSRRVYELVGERIHDEDDPMPPRPRALSEEQLAAIDRFVATDAPEREADALCEQPMTMEDGGMPDVGPDATPPGELPCTPSYEFRAFGEEERGYAVKANAAAGLTNEYVCFAFRAQFAPDEQAIAWGPHIGDDRIVHHWILYQTKTAQTEGTSFPCGALPAQDAVFLMGWAPGGGVEQMPDDVGLELPDDGFLLLQLHYYNAASLGDLHDDTGVSICTTDTPRANAAGVLTIGTLEVDIPERAVNHEVSYTCPGRVTQYLGAFTLMASAPHMHQRGRSFRTDIVRANGDVEMINQVEHWSFADQRRYPFTPFHQLARGDGVRVTCAYDNPTDQPISWGEGTDDEMCFDFMMVYPITNWPAQFPRFCVDIERYGF